MNAARAGDLSDRTRPWSTATKGALISLAVLGWALPASGSFEDRVFRMDQLTGEGYPYDLPERPAVGEWALLVEDYPAEPAPDVRPPTPEVWITDLSFGHVEWSFDGQSIFGRIEIPARDMAAVFIIRAEVETSVGHFALSITFDPPADYILFNVDGFGTPERLGYAERGEGRGSLTVAIDDRNTWQLYEAPGITVWFDAYSFPWRTPALFLGKGESGAAVFEEAFAAWGLVP